MSEKEFVSELLNLNINITEEQLKQLNKYFELLVTWNEKINLTAITKKEDVYLKHFYDSLTLNKIVNLNEIDSLCDIGTGAGFPGMVIKILFPNIKITLVDALNKRINFLNKVIDELNLKDITAIHARIEEYGTKNRSKYEIVTARAVTNLPVLLEYAIPLVKVNGYFIPMKAEVKEELENSKNALNILNSKIVGKCEFLLPKENSTRTLLKIEKTKEISNKYPRKNSVIKNNHL